MALSARDMLLIVRAQNQASGALRRVARDVNSLGNVKGLRQRAAQLRINEQVLRTQRQQALANEQSYRAGLKSLQMDKARATAKLEELKNDGRLVAIEKERLAISAQQARLQLRIDALTKRAQRLRAPASVAANAARLKAASADMERLALREADLTRRTEEANTAIARQSIALRELSAKEAEAARMADYWAGRQKVATDRLALNAAKIRETNKAINAARWDKLGAAGRIMQHTGRIFQYSGLVIGGSLAVAAKAAADFESESTLAATQVANKFRDTTKATKQISQGIVDLMAKGNAFASSQEQNASAYEIFSSMTLRGNQAQQIKQGMNLLGQFNRAAIAGQVDLKEVTEAGITILNDFSQQGQQVQNLPRFLNRMFAAVRFGRMTVGQFVGSLNQVAPAFSAAFGRTPHSFDQLSQAMASLTRHMPSTRMASAALARLTEMLSRKDFVTGMEKLGMPIAVGTGSNRHLKDLETIIQMMGKHRPDLVKGGLALQNFYKETTALGSGKAGTTGTIQGRRALQFLLQNFRSYHQLSKQVVNDNNEFSKSFRAMSDTSGVKWKLFVQQMHALAIEVGEGVIPVITRLSEPIQRLIKWFNGLDKATKDSIGKWGAYIALASTLAAALLFLGGTFVRLFAFMGRGVGLFNTIIVAVVATSAAVSALTGDWDGLNGVINTFVSFGTGSMAGWVAMLGLAAAGALKLRGALMGVAAAQGGSSAAGGLLGMFGRGRAATTGVKDLYQVRRLEGAGRIMAGVAASAAMIPGSLVVAGGAMAAMAAGALLWKRHMEAGKKEAQAAEDAMRNVKMLGAVPTAQASQLGGLGGAAANAQQAMINLRAANKAIADARKRGAGGDELKQLYIDRYNAAIAAQRANEKADKVFGALSRHLEGQGNLLNNLSKQGALLEKLRRQRARMDTSGQSQSLYNSTTGTSGVQDAKKLDRQIDRTIQRMNALRDAATKGAHALGANFSRAVQDLAKLDPKLKVNAKNMELLFRTALNKGRMLTIPEMKAIIRGDTRQLPGDIRRAVSKAKAQIRVEVKDQQVAAAKAKLTKSFSAAVGGWTNIVSKQLHTKVTVDNPKNRAQAIHSSMAKVFSKTIKQHISISPGPGAAHAKGVQIGAAIATGAKAGIDAQTRSVIDAAVNMVDQAVAAARHHGEIKSPSRLMAREVGKPLGQGIAMGILESRGDIQKAAALTIDIFQGSVLSNFTPGKKATKLQIDRAIHSLTVAQAALKKHNTESNRQRVDIARENLATLRNKGGKSITPAMLQRDLQGQLKQYRMFNNGLDRLRKRKVPSALLDQLRELGVGGAQNIAKLASMSDQQLKKYVATWKKAMKEINRSTTYNADDIKAALKSLSSDAAQSMLETYNSFNETSKSNFGDLFSGPSNLADKFGDTFQQAVDTYNSDLADYQSQIKDLNSQLVDINKQAFDDMASTFGQLFSGDWLSGSDVQTRLDWGQKLGFDDLEKDLESQLDKFKRWRSDLDSLAGKVPADLAKQLEALGPEAVDKLDILNGATSDQLAQYVDTWKQAQSTIGTAAQGAVQNSDQYTSQVNDILKQIDDITAKMAALSKPSGLSGQDVLNDIQGQIDAFGQYQDVLTDLANRGLPKELVQQLQQMGPSATPYLRALNSLTDQQLLGPGGFVDKWTTANGMITAATNTMMQTQLDIWYQYGANSAAQLIAGVSSQQQPLIDYFTNLFKNLLQGKTPDFNPPTTAGGGASYGDDALGRYLNNSLGGTSTVTHHTEINVNAVQDESLQSTMERATFRLTQRSPQ